MCVAAVLLVCASETLESSEILLFLLGLLREGRMSLLKIEEESSRHSFGNMLLR